MRGRAAFVRALAFTYAAATTWSAAVAAPSPAASIAPIIIASPGALRDLRVPADPAVTRRAREWLQRMQTGNVDRTQLDAKLNGMLTDTKIKAVAAQLGPLGEPTDFRFLRALVGNDGIAYVYGATFKAHPAMWVFSLDSAQKINGMVIRPLEEPRPVTPRSNRLQI